MPAAAARPIPTINAVGVASPSAQGHAITSTATALINATSRPRQYHPITRVMIAIPITTGTNTAETRSASCCTAALEPCACDTRRMMPASIVALPRAVTLQRNCPLPLMVAAYTDAPAVFATGMLSPVSIASLTEEVPSMTSPSTAMLSPGRTTKCIPGARALRGTSCKPCADSIQAVRGCILTSAVSAAEVRTLAKDSSHLPSRTSVTTDAAESK